MSKEHAYAYEAGYRDGAINYELEYCPACKNVADLQEALHENARLRELCADMWEYIVEPVNKRNNLKERLARLDDMGDRMRELGVEP